MCKSLAKGQKGRYCSEWRSEARGKLVGGLAVIITICSLLDLSMPAYTVDPPGCLLWWVLLCLELLKNTSRVLLRQGNFKIRPIYPKPWLIMESVQRGSTPKEEELFWMWADSWRLNLKLAFGDAALQVTGPFGSGPAWHEAKEGAEATVWVFISMLLTASFFITMNS